MRFTHQRLADPRAFDPRSFRTLKAKGGARIVVACPRGKYKSGRCTVGMGAQAILRPRRRRRANPAPEFKEPRLMPREVRLPRRAARWVVFDPRGSRGIRGILASTTSKRDAMRAARRLADRHGRPFVVQRQRIVA